MIPDTEAFRGMALWGGIGVMAAMAMSGVLLAIYFTSQLFQSKRSERKAAL